MMYLTDMKLNFLIQIYDHDNNVMLDLYHCFRDLVPSRKPNAVCIRWPWTVTSSWTHWLTRAFLRSSCAAGLVTPTSKWGLILPYGHCFALQWRHNGHDSVSNHQPYDSLLNRLFRRRSKKTSKLRVTGLCAGNSPGTGEFPAQMASNAENVSIWWRHHGIVKAISSTSVRRLPDCAALMDSHWL